MDFDELLDRLSALGGSDRKAAPIVGVSQVAFSAWRTRRALPNDDLALRIAELLGLDPAYVAAIVHAERAKTDESRAMWHRVRDAFGKAALLAIVSATPFLLPTPAQAAFNKNFFAASSEYTLRDKRRRKWSDV